MEPHFPSSRSRYIGSTTRSRQRRSRVPWRASHQDGDGHQTPSVVGARARRAARRGQRLVRPTRHVALAVPHPARRNQPSAACPGRRVHSQRLTERRSRLSLVDERSIAPRDMERPLPAQRGRVSGSSRRVVRAGSHDRGARRSDQGIAISRRAATRSRTSSRPSGATSCIPIGSPASFQCSGNEIAGCPVMLKGYV